MRMRAGARVSFAASAAAAASRGVESRAFFLRSLAGSRLSRPRAARLGKGLEGAVDRCL